MGVSSSSSLIELPLFVFTDDVWSPLPRTNPAVFGGADVNTALPSVLNELRIASYNVWFEKLYKKERALLLLNILERTRPHLVGLQEVTKEFTDVLARSRFIRDEYVVSDCDRAMSFDSWYGTSILVHRSLLRSTSASVQLLKTTPEVFGSAMGRDLLLLKLIYTVDVGQSGRDEEEMILFATTHLESLNFKKTRVAQLLAAANLLKQIRGSSKMPKRGLTALVGDFNFDSTMNWGNRPGPLLEQEALEKYFSDYHDVWREVRPNDRGVTFDAEANPMLLALGHGPEEMRYDRIMTRTRVSDSVWEPAHIVLLGNTVHVLPPEENDDGNDDSDGETGHTQTPSLKQQKQNQKHKQKPNLKVRVDFDLDAPIPSSQLVPSDHFGLLATLHRKQ